MAGLSAGLLGGAFVSGAAASTFYDWEPEAGSSGIGFIEFDTSGQMAGDFIDLEPIDFTFDFEDGPGGVPVITLSDLELPSDTSWSASGGVITSGEVFENASFFASTGLSLTFEAAAADCFAFGSSSCSQIAPAEPIEDILNSGSWVLRSESVPEIPLPAAAWLFVSALGGLGLVRRLRPRSA